jgi:hypothetical protein
MKHKTLFAMLGLAVAMIFAAPSKANAGVFVGVRVGPRPAYVVVAPRPYRYAYYPPRVIVAPAYAGPGFYYRGRWCPRPYAYRGFYGPRYFRR